MILTACFENKNRCRVDEPHCLYRNWIKILKSKKKKGKSFLRMRKPNCHKIIIPYVWKPI